MLHHDRCQSPFAASAIKSYISSLLTGTQPAVCVLSSPKSLPTESITGTIAHALPAWQYYVPAEAYYGYHQVQW